MSLHRHFWLYVSLDGFLRSASRLVSSGPCSQRSPRSFAPRCRVTSLQQLQVLIHVVIYLAQTAHAYLHDVLPLRLLPIQGTHAQSW